MSTNPTIPKVPRSREVITVEIARLKSKHDRLPAHFVDRRDEIMAEIDGLVDDWLAASA